MKKLRLIPTSLILLLTASVVFPVGYLIFAALSRPEGLRQMLLTGSKNPATLRFYENSGYNSNDKTAFIQWL